MKLMINTRSTKKIVSNIITGTREILIILLKYEKSSSINCFDFDVLELSGDGSMLSRIGFPNPTSNKNKTIVVVK